MSLPKNDPMQQFLVGHVWPTEDNNARPTGPVDNRTKKKKHRGFNKKNLKKPIDWFVDKLKDLKVKNPELIKTLNADGSVSIKHARVVSSLNKIRNGNRYCPKTQKSHFKRRKAILDKAALYVKSHGFIFDY